MKYVVALVLIIPALFVLFLQTKHPMNRPAWASSGAISGTIILISLSAAMFALFLI